MKMYERYVDDSNQIAKVRNEGDDEETLAMELRDIANNVMTEINMESDLPGRHEDGALPILDMACWLALSS